MSMKRPKRFIKATIPVLCMLQKLLVSERLVEVKLFEFYGAVKELLDYS